MAGEEYRERHDEEMDDEEQVRFEAIVNDVAYEVWQENGRDRDLEDIFQEMCRGYHDMRDRPAQEQPGWLRMINDSLERERAG